MHFCFDDLQLSANLEARQKLVRLGALSGSGASGRRRVHVLHTLCLSGVSAVYYTGSVFEKAGDALVAVVDADRIRRIAFDSGVAIRQFQVGWIKSMEILQRI